MWGRSSIGEAGAMWIKVSITGHDAGVGLPDIDEIREVGKAAHFCNKEVRKFSLSADCRLLAWPTSPLPVFNMSINPVKSQYTHATYKSRSNLLLPTYGQNALHTRAIDIPSTT